MEENDTGFEMTAEEVAKYMAELQQFLAEVAKDLPEDKD